LHLWKLGVISKSKRALLGCAICAKMPENKTCTRV
jgi:hypothetical protein